MIASGVLHNLPFFCIISGYFSYTDFAECEILRSILPHDKLYFVNAIYLRTSVGDLAVALYFVYIDFYFQ